MKISALWNCVAVCAISVSGFPPVSAADWKDSECRSDKDEGGQAVKVCRDKESIGVFWDDGSYVNGWCDGRDYEVEYEGLKKLEALSWIKYYCE